MKRVILLVLGMALILPAYIFSQDYAVDKGSIMVAGSAGFASAGGDLNEVNDEGLTVISVNPVFLYFIMPNIGVGGDFEYLSTSQGDASSTFLGLGPTVAYFIGNENSTMLPFVSVALLYGSSSIEHSDKIESTDMNFEFSGGAVLMAAKNVGFRASVFYLMQSHKLKDADESTKGSVFGLRVGVNGFVF